MTIVSSAGEDIYFEVTGDDGPVVVLGHGAGGNHASWFQQVPVLVAAGYRVITWDTRGFGCSTFRTGVHGQAAIVGDLAAVLDAAEVTRAQFVGQSLGGWSVTAFTLAHPERVQSATLTNTVGGLYTAALLEHLRTVTGLPALSPDLAHRDPARAFLYEQLASFQSPPMTEIASCLRERVDPALMSATQVPLLAITSTGDELFPGALVADSIRRVAGAEVVVIDGAGHSTYFERPDEFNAALLPFLERYSGASLAGGDETL